jgi:hypothetical protein
LSEFAKSGQTLTRALDRQACDAVGTVAWALVKRAIGTIHSALGDVYGDEADQIAGILGVSSNDIIAANLVYDGSHVGCSTFIAPAADGLLHARNLDWWFPRNLLKKHVVIKRMLNAPCGDYAMVSWPGVFGVLTAVGKRRFSVSVNHVSNSRNGTAAMVSRTVQGYWPLMWELRRAFDECKDFDAAVRFLKRVPLLSPVLFAIASTKKSEAVVIERDPDNWVVRKTSGDRALCVTNHYVTEEFEGENVDIEELDTEERLEFLESKLRSSGALDSQSALRMLSSNQLLCEGTQHQVAMSAKAGQLVARVPGEKAVEIRL